MVQFFVARLKMYESGVIGPSAFFEDCCQISSFLEPSTAVQEEVTMNDVYGLRREFKSRAACFAFQRGNCTRGAGCKFLHEGIETMGSKGEYSYDRDQTRFKKGICLDFASGMCNRGASCIFLHDSDNSRARESLSLNALMLTTFSEIADIRQRAHLQLRYVVKFPSVKTQCCGTPHCFQCKTAGRHSEGTSCRDEEDGLDATIKQCPACQISIVKGDGCNTIQCVCGEEFSWDSDIGFGRFESILLAAGYSLDLLPRLDGFDDDGGW
jgi:hypothetical protein